MKLSFEEEKKLKIFVHILHHIQFPCNSSQIFLLKICRISMAAFNSVGKLLQCGGASLERPFRYLGQECASHCCYFFFKQNIETVTLSIYIARLVGASEEKGQ